MAKIMVGIVLLLSLFGCRANLKLVKVGKAIAREIHCNLNPKKIMHIMRIHDVHFDKFSKGEIRPQLN